MSPLGRRAPDARAPQALALPGGEAAAAEGSRAAEAATATAGGPAAACAAEVAPLASVLLAAGVRVVLVTAGPQAPRPKTPKAAPKNTQSRAQKQPKPRPKTPKAAPKPKTPKTPKAAPRPKLTARAGARGCFSRRGTRNTRAGGRR